MQRVQKFHFPIRLVHHHRVDKLVVPRDALLKKVEPTTATGRTHSLTEKEQTEALNILGNL